MNQNRSTTDAAPGGPLTDELYQRLRSIAHGLLGAHSPGQTLQPTAVVHEAYLKLADADLAAFHDRNHFVSVGVRAMRQVIADYARRRGASKRGGDLCRVTFTELAAAGQLSPLELIAVDDALNQLVEADERQAQVVEMKFFGGMAMAEIAEALSISLTTAEREWRRARAWLQVRMAQGPG